ncbi:MAG: tetratricopeptide repeat protein [Planctomycetia bacterium]|nr:tetratricopeptide repeat protein [Planctomycetia bacterium]
MATDTAAVPSAITSSPNDPTRQFWQVPLLLLGLGAFVCVWQGWLPIGRADPATVFTRDITALKVSYEKLTPDPIDLKTQLGKVAAGVDAYPDQAPMARFHLGSGYVRLAEITALPEEARGYWTLARQHFDLIKANQLRDPADQPKLAFRFAKARAAVGLPENTPTADIALHITILSSVQPGDDGGETQRLIADLALRLTPPDVARAKAALAQYLTASGISTPSASLARAKLQLGELHWHSREYELARKWLSQIGTDAPPDVQAPAKALLGTVYMAEGNWDDAAKAWEFLRSANNIPPQLRLIAAYQLGVCKLNTRDPEGAASLLAEATKGEGAEAVAAAIRLADLHLRSPDPARHKAAVTLLATSVKGVSSPAAFDNPLVGVNEVQATFELAITVLLTDGAYEPALKVAEAYTAVSLAGREREKKGEVLAAWGASLERLKTGDPKPKFKAAGDEFAALAAFQPKTDGKLDMLRRAASLYRQAHEPNLAVAVLEDAVALPGIPEVMVGPLFAEFADALLAAGRNKDVWKALNKAMAAIGPMSTATRYRLARLFVDTRHPDLMPIGRALFEQIAKQQNVSPAEREFHERALTELANDLIRRGNFVDAEARLRTQLSLYPNEPEAGLARLLLGVCLLQRAAASGITPLDATKMRTEAVTLFKQIVAESDAAEKRKGKLTEREAWLRLQAALRVLQTYQQMKKPHDLLTEAVPMLDRYKGTVEELIILSLMYHAFKQMNEPGKALDLRDRMKEVFDKLPPTAFSPTATGEYSRDYWLKVWFAPAPK